MKIEHDSSGDSSKNTLGKSEKSLNLSSIDPEILDTFLKVRALRQAMSSRLLGDSWTTAEPGKI